MKNKPPIYIPLDEDGEPVAFNMPASALHPHSTKGQFTMALCTENKLFAIHYKEADRSDVLIHDLDDKINLVEKLHRRGLMENWRGAGKKERVKG